MRTNIVLDDELVAEAFKVSSAKTKRELVWLALTEYVENRKRHDLRKLRGIGAIRDDYDHKKLRSGGG